VGLALKSFTLLLVAYLHRGCVASHLRHLIDFLDLDKMGEG